MTIEQTFNDIWGVAEGRSLWRKVVYYWTSITLGPIVLFTALAVTGTTSSPTRWDGGVGAGFSAVAAGTGALRHPVGRASRSCTA